MRKARQGKARQGKAKRGIFLVLSYGYHISPRPEQNLLITWYEIKAVNLIPYNSAFFVCRIEFNKHLNLNHPFPFMGNLYLFQRDEEMMLHQKCEHVDLICERPLISFWFAKSTIATCCSSWSVPIVADSRFPGTESKLRYPDFLRWACKRSRVPPAG